MKRQICQGEGADGYLTVFLSLTLPLMLSLFFTLIYGTRVHAVRMQTELIMDTALRSCLGEYSRELLEQYDLFFIDAAYGMPEPSQEYVRRHLESYVAANCSGNPDDGAGRRKSMTSLIPEGVSIDGTRYAADRNFTAVLEQITAYMSADPAGAAVSNVLSLFSSYDNTGLDLEEWQREKEAVGSDLEEVLEEEELDPEEEENPTKDLDDFRGSPMLDQVFGRNGTAISEKKADLSGLFSRRDTHYGDGIQAESSHQYTPASAAVLNLYLSEKCGSFQSPKEKSLLGYEREYILCGEDSDRENLEKALARLCAVRTAANCMYLFSSGTRRQQARALAAVIGSAAAVPALIPVFTTAILLAWGYVESISDLRTLTGGGKVPLLKDDESWATDVEDILKPSDTGTSNRTRGLEYDDYLGLLLYLEGMNDKCTRLMDVMEMDIRMTPGNAGFCMDWCLDTLSATIQAGSGIGYSCSMSRTVTYN